MPVSNALTCSHVQQTMLASIDGLAIAAAAALHVLVGLALRHRAGECMIIARHELVCLVVFA
jgi:hypothetical protein